MNLTKFLMVVLLCCIMTSCGNSSTNNTQESFAGEYISTTWHEDTVAHFYVNQNGELSGNLLNKVGYVYDIIGSVTSSGTMTFLIRDHNTLQTYPESTLTATCSSGICTGTAPLPSGQSFPFSLTKISPDLPNNIYGIYTGNLSQAITPDATCWFGVDSNGNIYGFEYFVTDVNIHSLTGSVNLSNGNFRMTSNSADQQNYIVITGTIEPNGSINNAIWQGSSNNGEFIGSKYTAN